MENQTTNEDLTQYCAPGAKVTDEMIAVSEQVSLRVMTFEPAEKNNNPVVLFVAGWVSLIDGWQIVLQEMTKDYKVIYFETREKNSARISRKAGYGIADIGNDLVTFIDTLELEDRDFLLFGSSLGGTVILDSCRYLKKKPLCLVLVGPNAEFRVPAVWKVVAILFWPPLYFLLRPFVLWYLKTFRLDAGSDPAQYIKYRRALTEADPWRLRKGIITVWNYSVWDYLHDIDLPTLLVGASKDLLHEPGNLKRMVSLMPDARYIDLETNKKTHSEEVVQAMREYLGSLPGFPSQR